MNRILFIAIAGIGLISVQFNTGAQTANNETKTVDTATLHDLGEMYRHLIEAEDAKDMATVSKMVWKSSSTLFVAKTATAAEGNWAGFWGYDNVIEHLTDITRGTFRIEPDYPNVKTVALSRDVAETYAPVKITVAYAGQSPVPKPFLMIIDWIRTSSGWKMATDIALPIPPPPASNE